ncbi:MAG: magnesium transporter [Lentisphaerae bacterium]|jgi:magnesium transporter|nr:magnesium transporter [Lentisphaerota bacterium]
MPQNLTQPPVVKNTILHAIQSGRVIELPPSGKEEALRKLAKELEACACDEAVKQAVFDNVIKREAQAITYLGYGIACPHARADCGGELQCVIGWSEEGIEYGNTDGWPVHLILMYFVPDSTQNEYLTQLASLARAIEADDTKYELVNLDDLEEVKERLGEWVAAMEGRGDEDDDDRKMALRATCTVLSHLLMPDIIEMLESRRLNDLRIFLAAQPIPEIAELIAALTNASDQILAYRLLPRNMAGEVFSHLDYPSQNLLLENMAQDETRQILAALSPDDRTALFEELPANVTRRLLNLLNDQERRDALSLLSYPKDSVGRLMTNRYVAVREDATVAETLDHIRDTGDDSETVMMIYVINDNGVLVDDILLRKIILAKPQTVVSDLMEGQFVALDSLQDREEAVAVFKKYDVYSLPVVDAEGVLLGIVTNDDILDVSEAEATEDFHKTSAVRPLSVGYLKTPLHMLYRSRLPWLIALVFVNVFSGAGIAHFEELLSVYMALIFFLPLLIDSGGNAGSQSATLVIRSMALGEITLKDFGRTFWREIIVSMTLGLSMSVAVFFLGWWRSGSDIGLVAALAMIAVVMMSSLTGMVLPFALRKVKVDPAVASGPLVTSLVDILGIIIYLNIASLLLAK